MLERDYSTKELFDVLTQMSQSTNAFSHFEFYNWFKNFFQLVCVDESISLAASEYNILYDIDADIDLIVDFDTLSYAECADFKYDQETLLIWLALMN